MLLGSLLTVALWEFCRPRRRREFSGLRRRLGNIGFWVFNLVLGFTFEPAARFRPQLEAVLRLARKVGRCRCGVEFCRGFLLLDLLRISCIAANTRCRFSGAFTRCITRIPMST